MAPAHSHLAQISLLLKMPIVCGFWPISDTACLEKVGDQLKSFARYRDVSEKTGQERLLGRSTKGPKSIITLTFDLSLPL